MSVCPKSSHETCRTKIDLRFHVIFVFMFVGRMELDWGFSSSSQAYRDSMTVGRGRAKVTTGKSCISQIREPRPGASAGLRLNLFYYIYLLLPFIALFHQAAQQNLFCHS